MNDHSHTSACRAGAWRYVGAAIAVLLVVLPAVALAAPPTSCDVASVVARDLPSVVNITVAKVLRADGPGGKATGPEHLEVFAGSGVIVDPSGVIVTNKHVIEDAARIKVTFHDRTQVNARLITAALIDFALLKVDVDRPLPTLQFGDSDTLQVGQTVIAVGNPLGLGTSVSTGVVSATDRDLMRSPFDDYIQTDASINPGNSGGPLLDCTGDIIGIDTALYSNNTLSGSIGLGFALPSNMAQLVTYRMLHPRLDTPNWVGVHLQDVTPAIARLFGLSEVGGAIVTGVDSGSPAAHASLQPGDIITSVDGQELPQARAIYTRIVVKSPGEPIALSVWRDRHPLELTMHGKQWPDLAEMRAKVLASAASIARAESAGIGLHLVRITPSDRKRYALGDVSGVLISSVAPGSEADSVRLAAGDVVERIDNVAATTPDQVLDRLTHPDPEQGDLVGLLVRRKSGDQWVTLYVGRLDPAALMAPPPPYVTGAPAATAAAPQR